MNNRQHNPLSCFMREVQKVDEAIDVVDCALLISCAFQPGVEWQEMRRKLAKLVHSARQLHIASAAQLAQFMAIEQNFSGSTDSYYAVDNSYINRVLETKVGIPISLALLYMHIGRKLGLNVYGISFPGHFLVGVKECLVHREQATTPGLISGRQPNAIDYDDMQAGRPGKESLIDPFSGKIVSRARCYELIKILYHREVESSEHYFSPARNTAIVLRLLENLKGIYWRQQNIEKTLRCLDMQLIAMPSNEQYLQQQQKVLQHSNSTQHGEGGSKIH